ncbi:MAG: helix-turn-helix domain-containing protein [Gammaproteobacteria bacterium]|jgi:cytoskeleton protein RodZ
MSDNLEIEQSEQISTPGRKLCKAREALGLTQEEIARRMFLNKATIQALESDDYARFSAVAYIKGYLASYANMVGLPKEEILQEFAKIMPGMKEPSLLTPEVSSETSKEIFSAKIMKMFSIGVFFALILLVLLWVFGHHSSDSQPVDNSVVETSKPADVPPSNVTPGNVTLVPSNDSVPVAPQPDNNAATQTLNVGGEQVEVVKDASNSEDKPKEEKKNKSTKEEKNQESSGPPVVDISVPQNSSGLKKNNKVSAMNSSSSLSGRVINLSESSAR